MQSQRVLCGRMPAGVRALVAARAAAVRVPAGASVSAGRSFHMSRPAFAKEFIGEGLEADPTRGVRIKPSAFHAVPGVPRSSEYDSVLEQDPFGDTHETGGNDDIWGEWGLDRDAPFLSTLQAMGMLATGLGALYVTYKTAVANSPKPVAAPREGLWEQDKVGMSVPE